MTALPTPAIDAVAEDYHREAFPAPKSDKLPFRGWIIMALGFGSWLLVGALLVAAYCATWAGIDAVMALV